MTERSYSAITGMHSEEFVVTKEVQGDDAATAANYGKIFTCPQDRKCKVLAISEVHTTKGSDAGAVTLTVERLQATEVSGGGDALLATALDLKGDAETVQHGTLVETTVVELSEGDRLNLIDSGTLTAVAGVCVSVLLRWMQP